MIKNVLFVQPFLLEKDALSDEILIWEVYLENYLKNKISSLQFDLLYLPLEQDLGNLNITSFEEIEMFEDQMVRMVSKLKFEPNSDTLIGISVTTSHHYLSSVTIANFFHKYYPEAFIVLGGAHASACPKDYVKGSITCDFIIIGEGEVPLYNLIKRPLKKQKIPLILAEDPINDLDELPTIDFSIFDKYINNFKHLSISLSRGCPFRCVFCMENTLLKNHHVKKWRSYSPKRAIIEVQHMIEYGSKYGMEAFGFYDPIFGLNQKWLNKFLELYTFKDQTYAWIETRIDILNETLLKKMDQNNFFLMYGLESYSKQMLSVMNKTNNPNYYLKKFEELFEIHKKLGSLFIVNILINHPGETEITQLETFNKLEDLILEDNVDPQSFNIRFYHHFPGTRIYNKFNDYYKKYDTFSFFPEWYKSEDLLKYGAYTVRPSTEFSLRESFSKYTLYYQNLLNTSIGSINRSKQKSNLFKIVNLKKQISNLNKKKNSFFVFLDEKKIEID